MGQYTSYWLYQKYEKRGSQEAIPVYPNVYSVDGDGTMSKVIKIENDAACGYVPTGTTQYRWVNLDPSVDYYCDECPAVEPIYRWIKSDDTICVEYVPPTPTFNGKFKANYDGGQTYSAACDSSTELTTGTTKPSGYEASAMTSANIGNCVTSIGAYSFGDYRSSAACTSLSSVTIPNSVTSIGDFAFEFCSGLTSIRIPDSVTTIDDGAFMHCRSLTSVTIGSGVTSISNEAFYDCTSLTSITVNATTPPSLLGCNAFENTNGCPIYVPASSVSAYKSATNWSTYADRIQPIS